MIELFEPKEMIEILQSLGYVIKKADYQVIKGGLKIKMYRVYDDKGKLVNRSTTGLLFYYEMDEVRQTFTKELKSYITTQLIKKQK